MKTNIKVLLGLRIGFDVMCVIGIIIACIESTSLFNFTTCGGLIALVFGIFTFVTLAVLCIELSC